MGGFMRFRIRNLDRFQHYKSNNGAQPRWIKWYVSDCLNDPKFMAMSDGAKWAAQVAVWIALGRDDREVPRERLEFQLRRKLKADEEKDLIDAGFFEDSRGTLEELYSNSRATLEQNRREEKRGEEKRNTPATDAGEGFDDWWACLTGRIQDNGRRTKGSKQDAFAAWKKLKLAPIAADVIQGTKLYQREREKPKDAERILTKKLWKQALEEATPTGPVVDKTSGGVQWRGNQPQQPRVDPARASDLAEAIQDTGLTRGYRFKAAEDAIEAHPDEQDMDKLAEIARRCAWDWQREINSEAWQKRQEEEGAA